MPAKAGTRKLQRLGHKTKENHMKQMSQSISNSTKSLPGRWTRVTTLGCILALVFLGATRAQPKASGTARPIKATAVMAMALDPSDPSGASGTFEAVGTATHLGNFVFPGTWKIIGLNANGRYVYEIHGTYTAANGDTIVIVCPDWGIDDGANSVVDTGIVHITGGTGRFASASGSYVGSLSPVSSPTLFLFTAEGTISY
jgi:hypothetical protein